MKQQLTRLWNIWKQYLSNCGIHGVRYLVDNNLSWIERVFWLISCMLCWWGCMSTIVNVIRNYSEIPVILSAENANLNWQTPFPSISLCIKSTYRMENKSLAQSSDTFETAPPTKVIRTFIQELPDAYEEIKVPCNMFLRKCTWDNVEFDCCEKFLPLFQTGVGHCLTANSVHTGQGKADNLHFFINRTAKYGDLVVDIVMDNTTNVTPELLTVYVLNNYQIPTQFSNKENQKAKVKKGFTSRVDITLIDVYNEKSVRSVPMERRNCRFANENDDIKMHYMYSGDTCIIELYIRQMLKICGCVNFINPMSLDARVCNITGLKCIFDNEHEIKSKAVRKSCLQNCEGTIVILLYNEPSTYYKLPRNIAGIHFNLLNRPLIRYRRYAISDLQDLVVSIGSTFGLFMGASILSFFEMLYWLFVRRDEQRNL